MPNKSSLGRQPLTMKGDTSFASIPVQGDGSGVTTGLRGALSDSPRAMTAPGGLSPGINRWRKGTRKLITHSRISGGGLFKREPGASPGVDIRRPEDTLQALERELRARVDISVIDYSATAVKRSDLSNVSLGPFLDQDRPPGFPCRWIICRGLSFDVVRLLAARFDLHPLAVEDAVHLPQRIKPDFFENQLFLSMKLVALGAPLAGSQTGHTGHVPTKGIFSTWSSIQSPLPPGPEAPTLNSLTVEQVSLFLMRNGTLISLFEHDGDLVSVPILKRLNKSGTLLRDSEDTSFLMQSIVDTIVDHAGPVTEKYHEILNELEKRVIGGTARADDTKELHLLSRELQVLRRTLIPTQNLITSLQNKSSQHNVETMNSSIATRSNTRLSQVPSNAKEPSPSLGAGLGLVPPASPPPKRFEFLTALTRLYLTDVNDHILDHLDNIEMDIADSRNLIDLIFNTISHQTSQSTSTLTIVSVVFLSINFLAGVFGMNFEVFPELKWQLGLLYFWGLCGAVTLILFAFFRWKRLDMSL